MFFSFKLKQNWLKPGGQLFISDYACAPKNEWSKDFEEYVNQRRYTLLTVPDYGKVKLIDSNQRYIDLLTNRFWKVLVSKMSLLKMQQINLFNA